MSRSIHAVPKIHQGKPEPLDLLFNFALMRYCP